MSTKKNESGNFLPMKVTDDVTVKLLPHDQHEFLMSTKDVGIGYGASSYTIRMALMRHPDELNEGKHFVKGVTICYTQPHQVFWTKRGIVRLGFFIKSERAKLFRDWAEELIIKLEEQRDLFGTPVPRPKELPGRRKHNRLTAERLLSIMADVCLIDDKALRSRIAEKLMLKGGQA